MLLLLAGIAHAFCGAYVGGAGATLDNAASVVVLAQDGGRTTLTLVPDVQGDTSDFGVIIPVPADLGADAITTGDAAAVALLDQYSVPRGVAYNCDDLWSATPSGGTGCASPLGSEDHADASVEAADADDEVAVHSARTVGNYDLSLVSATGGGSLADWLDTQGFVVPDGGEAPLDEYVDSGSWFLTARVSLDTAPTERTGLSPLRIAYDGETWLLPIRLGTISASGPQEVIVLAVADQEVGISNYPELTIDDECMWRGEDLDATYEDEISTAVEEAGGAGWIREYSWDLSSHCDPCTTEQTVDAATLSAVGYGGNTAHLTRLRLRYATDVTQDVSLYPTGRTGVTDQVRFIRYASELEEWFPICDEGWAETPGTCPDVEGAGCDTPLAPVTGLGSLVALAILRRRR